MKRSSDTGLVVAETGTTWSRDASYVYDPIRNTWSMTISMTILGEPASKSNSRNIAKNRKTGSQFSRKSDKALSYVESFVAQVPPEFKGLAWGSERALLRATCSVWYASWKPDVDVELVWDCLQLAGVVSNDRWIREKFIYGAHIDKENPRVEIRLEEI